MEEILVTEIICESFFEEPQAEPIVPVEPPTRYSIHYKGNVVLGCWNVEDALFLLRTYRLDSVTRNTDGKLLAFQNKTGANVKNMLKLGDL